MTNRKKCICGQEIIFLKTGHGKKIPVNWQEGIGPEETFTPQRHISHFATCTKAQQFRKSKKEK